MTEEKITSVEELAALTQSEFLRAEKRFDRIDGTLKAVVDTLDIMRADIHDIKIALGPLVRSVAALEDEVRGLDKRVARLEEKASVAS